MNNKITLKYEYDTSEITAVYNGLGTTHEFLEQIESFMIAAGWHPESVKQSFIEKAEELQMREELDSTVDDGLDDESIWDEFIKEEGQEIGNWGLKPGESCFYSIGKQEKE